jgi:4-hydroxy-tetrahydrodipicolinate synthase
MKVQKLLDLSGLGVAMVTPFQKNGQVDFVGLQKLTEYLIKGGVDYLVVQGTTGETPTLSYKEKRATLDFIIEVNNGRLPIILGLAGNDTAALCEEIKSTDLKGVSAILTASPGYNKPTQEGIFQHYQAIDKVSPLPIILYNVPGRTASNVTAETTIRIAKECKNVIAVKEASGNMSQIMHLIHDAPEDFQVLSGDDAFAFPLIACGARGVISVVGNAFPESFSDMVHLALDGKFTEARPIHMRMIKTIDLLFVDGNPAGIKEALSYLNICEKYVRLPLVSITEQTKANLYQSIAESELLNPA